MPLSRRTSSTLPRKWCRGAWCASSSRRMIKSSRARSWRRSNRSTTETRWSKAEAARTRVVVANRDLEAARTLVAKAGKALELAETGYDQIREVELMVGVKKEGAKDAQTGLESAEHQLQFTQVRAPFPGVVVK